MEPNFKLPHQPKIPPGFSVPNGYFETFSEQLFDRIDRDNSAVIRLKAKQKKRWYLAAASIVVGILSLSLYLTYQKSEQEVDAAMLENYLTYHAAISEEDIVNILDEKDLEKISMDLHIPEKDLEEALKNTENIEQYLID